MPYTRTKPYHPQENAKVERVNRTIEDGLAKCCEERHCDWSLNLQTFMTAYRSAVHESTGHAPFRTIFGTETRMPIDLVYELQSGTTLVNNQDSVYLRVQNNAARFTFVLENTALNITAKSKSLMKNSWSNLQS